MKIVIAVLAALVLSATAAAGNPYHHHWKPKPVAGFICSDNGTTIAVPDIEKALKMFPDAKRGPCPPPVVTPPDEGPPPVINPTVGPPTPQFALAPEAPNADAFCYGSGATSYMWITPDEYVFLTTTGLWTHGTIANVTKGDDATGVMQNGLTPTCAKGKPTGVFVDNQGWPTTDGLEVFTGFTNPQGTITVGEHYQVVG